MRLARFVSVAAALAALCACGVGVAAAQTPAGAQPLTLRQAEQIAVDSHPQIKAVQYSARAASQTIREARSAYFPTVFGSLTGADAATGSRIAAGGLNNPVIYNRFATGFTVSQMLTDFGRTNALVYSAALTSEAADKTVDQRKADVVLRVDRAYYAVLRAQAVERVAQETVETRQLVADQVAALAASSLKSSLDVSFANVNLAEARLLLSQARNDTLGAFAELAAALGSPDQAAYVLSEEPMPPPPPDDVAALVATAVRERPDVESQRLTAEASRRFALAERNLFLPSVSLVGSFGMTPYRQLGLNDHYSAMGITVNVPVTNGSLFAARRTEATFRAEAADERLHDARNQVTRDVRTAWLDARTAYERLGLTDQLLAQATLAADLAQTRYDIGLSSIIELTQAQLNKTQAEIAQASARYDYQAKTAALRYETGQVR